MLLFKLPGICKFCSPGSQLWDREEYAVNLLGISSDQQVWKEGKETGLDRGINLASVPQLIPCGAQNWYSPS